MPWEAHMPSLEKQQSYFSNILPSNEVERQFLDPNTPKYKELWYNIHFN